MESHRNDVTASAADNVSDMDHTTTEYSWPMTGFFAVLYFYYATLC